MIAPSTDTAGTWLAPFGDALRQAVGSWIGHSPITVQPPDPAHTQFRLDPYTHLPRLCATLDGMRRTLPDPGKVLWFFDSLEHRGLEVDEVRAILNPWLALQIVQQADLGGAVLRVLAAGRFRHEHLGLALTLDRAAMANADHTERVLAQLGDGGLPPTVLFVTCPDALLLDGMPRSPLRRLLRYLGHKGTAPGLLVPGPRVNVTALQAYAACMRRLWNAEGPDLVVRSRTAPADCAEIEALARAAHRAGATFDASVAISGPGPFPDGIRTGSYFATGAYVPQPFDLRSPAARAAQPPRLLELTRTELPADGLRHLWQDSFDPDVPLLARLTDYFRIESYLTRSTDIGLAQRYHEFRIYNWGADESPVRTLLVDAGPLPAAPDARAMLRDVARLATDRGPRFHTAPRAFFDAARVEAAARAGAHAPLRIQADEHTYLEGIPRNAPLRADVECLLHGLPADLGSTLEIGAGYGRLAVELSARASRYICLDLDPEMMRDLRREAGQQGIVADIHRLPFLPRTFQTVLANNVLEHADEPVTVLAGLARVLTPDGALHALIPLDALNARHRLRAHLWKADLTNIRTAAAAAGLDVEAADMVNLYSLGIAGAFPSCEGLVCRLLARRARR